MRKFPPASQFSNRCYTKPPFAPVMRRNIFFLFFFFLSSLTQTHNTITTYYHKEPSQCVKQFDSFRTLSFSSSFTVDLNSSFTAFHSLWVLLQLHFLSKTFSLVFHSLWLPPSAPSLSATSAFLLQPRRHFVSFSPRPARKLVISNHPPLW